MTLPSMPKGIANLAVWEQVRSGRDKDQQVVWPLFDRLATGVGAAYLMAYRKKLETPAA